MARQAALRRRQIDLDNRAMVVGPVHIDVDGWVHILGEIAVANGGAEREANARYLHHRVRLPGIPLGPIVQEEEQFIPEPDPEQFLFEGSDPEEEVV